MKKTTLALIGAVLFAFGVEAAEVLKVGIYVGDGTYGLGAPRWTEIVHFAPDLREVPLDAGAVADGALEGCAALILPQGDAKAMSEALGPAGRAAIRRFVENGGGCLASGGGAFLLMSAGGAGDRVGILPYGECGSFGLGATDEMHVDYSAGLSAEFPIRRASDRRLAWEGGSPLMPSAALPPELAGKAVRFDAVGWFRGNLNVDSVPHQTLRGQVCDVRGTYGKGRVWATVLHGEFTPASRDITAMLLQYVLGRCVAWQLPQREQKQLAVSVVVDGTLGVGRTKLLMRMLDDKAFDVAVVTQEDYDGFWLRHSDAVLKASELSDAAVARLSALKAAPEEPATVLKRVKQSKPLKAVVYCGPGIGDAETFNFATILDDSPKYTVEFQDGSRIRNGSLEGRDLLLVPGGYSSQIKEVLAPGVEQLRAFLRNGGTYYGACAGSFVTLQPRSPKDVGLGLVPFRARQSPYRGHAHPTVVFNDDAKDWGLDKAVHRVLYWGGPEHEPGTPIEDCDVRVLARFNCETIDTYGKNGSAMKDWSAIVGGRIGKGRIVSTSVHPEEDETQFYLVYAGLRYLHGEQPKPNPINRRRGALAVGYFMPFVCSEPMMSFALDLRRDTRFDVRPQSEHMDICGYARHLDVYVFGNGFKGTNLQYETVEYFRRGGHGIFVTADPMERAKIAGLTKDFANVVIVATHAEAKSTLEKLCE